MGRRRTGWFFLALLLLSGCQNRDAQQLARIGTKISHKAEALFAGARLTEGWPALPISLGDLSLDARVAARLRWDRNLADLNLRVRSEGGNVELQGQIKDLDQRRRAVELAETTSGVERVTDKLEGPQ
jgi:hypothetical protein